MALGKYCTIYKRIATRKVIIILIPKRNERSELVHSVGIVPRLSPPVRPLIRMSAGKAWFHTPRLAAEKESLLVTPGPGICPGV